LLPPPHAKACSYWPPPPTALPANSDEGIKYTEEGFFSSPFAAFLPLFGHKPQKFGLWPTRGLFFMRLEDDQNDDETTDFVFDYRNKTPPSEESFSAPHPRPCFVFAQEFGSTFSLFNGIYRRHQRSNP
jgi:hypothetical protein